MFRQYAVLGRIARNVDLEQAIENGILFLGLLRQALRHRLLHAKRIGFYLPTGEEIDLLPLLNAALWLKRACYLPVIPKRGARRLWFSRIGGRDTWYQNRFGIFEHAAREKRRARQLDVLFMPLVAFDASSV